MRGPSHHRGTQSPPRQPQPETFLISNLKSVRDESGIKLFYLFFLTSFDMKLLKIEIVMIRIEKLFVQ